MPEFQFRLDTSYDNFAKIDRLLRSPEVARDLGRRRRDGQGLMARRGKKKGRPVSGWLVLDKPVGMGSTGAVVQGEMAVPGREGRACRHLDPLASGMLPIALGEATKTVPYVHGRRQGVRFTVAWGEERSTDDLEGTPPAHPTGGRREAEVGALLPRYTGVIMQTPPQFSAVKIDGNRAYDLAREGEAVDIPPREVEIGRFDMIGHRGDGASSRSNAARALMCARWRAIWAATSAASATSRSCAGTEVEPFTSDDLVTVDELEGAARRPATRATSRFASPDGLFWSRPPPHWSPCRSSQCPTIPRPASGWATPLSCAAATRRSRPTKSMRPRAAN